MTIRGRECTVYSSSCRVSRRSRRCGNPCHLRSYGGRYPGIRGRRAMALPKTLVCTSVHDVGEAMVSPGKGSGPAPAPSLPGRWGYPFRFGYTGVVLGNMSSLRRRAGVDSMDDRSDAQRPRSTRRTGCSTSAVLHRRHELWTSDLGHRSHRPPRRSQAARMRPSRHATPLRSSSTPHCGAEVGVRLLDQRGAGSGLHRQHEPDRGQDAGREQVVAGGPPKVPGRSRAEGQGRRGSRTPRVEDAEGRGR